MRTAAPSLNSGALPRAFSSPAQWTQASRQASPWARCRLRTLQPCQNTCASRAFSATPHIFANKGVDAEARVAEMNADEARDKRWTYSDFMTKTGKDRLPKDMEITDPKIFIIENGDIKGPVNTRKALEGIKTGESLRMIRPYTPPKDGVGAQYALCKVVNAKEEYQAEKQRKENKKGTAKPKTKEVEMSWSISPHDLVTKMRQLGEFLNKGNKIEVVLGKKKKGRAASQDEAQAILKKLREEIENRNGMESKPAQGEVGATMRLMIESKSTKS